VLHTKPWPAQPFSQLWPLPANLHPLLEPLPEPVGGGAGAATSAEVVGASARAGTGAEVVGARAPALPEHQQSRFLSELTPVAQLRLSIDRGPDTKHKPWLTRTAGTSPALPQ